MVHTTTLHLQFKVTFMSNISTRTKSTHSWFDFASCLSSTVAPAMLSTSSEMSGAVNFFILFIGLTGFNKKRVRVIVPSNYWTTSSNLAWSSCSRMGTAIVMWLLSFLAVSGHIDMLDEILDGLAMLYFYGWFILFDQWVNSVCFHAPCHLFWVHTGQRSQIFHCIQVITLSRCSFIHFVYKNSSIVSSWKWMLALADTFGKNRDGFFVESPVFGWNFFPNC